MIVHRATLKCLFIFLATLFAGESVRAHGGVVEEDDLCVIKVNYLRAHFKIYQPQAAGHEQYCEDLPVASESIFVMEYQHDSLSEMPIDFRIIRDVTGKGRFARMADIDNIDDIDGVTVYYRPPEVEPDIYLVNYVFEEEGEFIGIVSARNPETGKAYAAVFPFEVGFTGFGYWPFFIGLLVLIQFQYLFMSGRLKRWMSKGATASALLVLALFVTAPPAFAADYQVTWSVSEGPLEINRMHSWILHIEDENGKALEGAIVDVEGGMPEHDHGLPTKPRVTKELGDGDYRLEGMRFHMSGYWEVIVTITTDTGTSTVTVPLQL